MAIKHENTEIKTVFNIKKMEIKRFIFIKCKTKLRIGSAFVKSSFNYSL